MMKFFKKQYIQPNIKSDSEKEKFGCIDSCTEDGVSGWFLDLDSPTENRTLLISIDGIEVGNIECELPRPDIDDIAGFETNCGFLFSWADCTLPIKLLNIETSKQLPFQIHPTNDKRQISGPVTLLDIAEVKLWASKSKNQDTLISKDNKSNALDPKTIANMMESMPLSHVKPDASEVDVKLIAYYLPQFHPIKENDEWWGPGFTEWTNVTQAKPYFKDHYQPHVPGELGFYDLRLPEVREAQANLAREYGIHGFCYYYYWFSGRRILERPLQEVFESGKPDFPFCICWANENWSRRWDGSENEILLEQVHNEKTDEDFIHDVIPLFKDPRYIRVNGAPILIIYRISLMPNPKKTAQKWRKICAENGIPEIHLCMAESFGLNEPRQYGFDSAVQFPPHNTVAGLENDNVEDLDKDFTGNIYDYGAVVEDQFAREAPTYKRYPGVMATWDNTSRKKKTGNVFLNATPNAYETWLRGAIDHAKDRLPNGERLVFINAWNEWAEGTHLEPDRKHGRAYLEATRRALTGQTSWQSTLDYAEKLPEIKGAAKDDFIASMRFALDRLDKVNKRLLGVMGDHGLPKYWTTIKPGIPTSMQDLEWVQGGDGKWDQLNHFTDQKIGRVGVDRFQKLYLYGWACCDGVTLKDNTPTYLILEEVNTGETYFAIITQRVERTDVAKHLASLNDKFTKFCGIKTLVDISEIPAGTYSTAIASRTEEYAVLTQLKEWELEIV